MNALFQLVSYCNYRLHARHRHGFGVHSPFAFRLITNVIENKHPYYIYKEVESQRQKLLRDTTEIHVTDFGTRPSGTRRLCDIVRKAVKPARQAQLIFRLALEQKPQTIVELGSSVGLTTAYLSKACHNGTLHTFEGSAQLIDVARSSLNACHVGANTLFHQGNIDETLPEVLWQTDNIDVAFLDANHTLQATRHYFDLLVKAASPDALFIIDDIHSSLDMRQAWEYIRQHRRVRVSFDLFSLGLAYLDPQLQKQHYILNW
ncbi:MAG: class I SAM-dependent methyltransferase [Paludibacteraceae bacterium]|nr:class I SAM-dependent methyltransferase [Paludibacteraceae bacterium]